MKILVKVTKEILDKTSGCFRNAAINCAITEAVRDMFPYAFTINDRVIIFDKETHCLMINDAHYTDGGIDIRNYKSIASIGLPSEAMFFILEFDEFVLRPELRRNMKPIQFEIDVPNEVIDQIGISTAYKVLSESKTLELVSI